MIATSCFSKSTYISSLRYFVILRSSHLSDIEKRQQTKNGRLLP